MWVDYFWWLITVGFSCFDVDVGIETEGWGIEEWEFIDIVGGGWMVVWFRSSFTSFVRRKGCFGW